MIKRLAYGGLANFASLTTENNVSSLRVLMYHRVENPEAKPHLAPCTLSATPEGFSQQIRYLSENHAIVSINDVIDAIQGKRSLPSRAVLITFDDAYNCFLRNAWPILHSHGIPAVLFVPSLFPGARQQRFWWDLIHELVYCSDHQSIKTESELFSLETESDKHHTFEKLTDQYVNSTSKSAQESLDKVLSVNELPPRENDVMTWEDIRSLVKQGLELGAHSQTHPLLSQMSAEDAREEIDGSITEIQKQTGCKVRAFAYPVGAHNRETIDICQQSGIEVGFTICRGSNDLRKANRFRLRRINVGRRANVAKLKTQLLLRTSWINLMFKQQKI